MAEHQHYYSRQWPAWLGRLILGHRTHRHLGFGRWLICYDDGK